MSRKSFQELLVGVGVAALGVGISILVFGTIPESGLRYDGTKRYLYGTLWLLVGVAMIAKGGFIKVISSPDKVAACPKCGTAYNQQEITDQKCPACQVELEGLKGFYDRHPDLK